MAMVACDSDSNTVDLGATVAERGSGVDSFDSTFWPMPDLNGGVILSSTAWSLSDLAVLMATSDDGSGKPSGSLFWKASGLVTPMASCRIVDLTICTVLDVGASIGSCGSDIFDSLVRPVTDLAPSTAASEDGGDFLGLAVCPVTDLLVSMAESDVRGGVWGCMVLLSSDRDTPTAAYNVDSDIFGAFVFPLLDLLLSEQS